MSLVRTIRPLAGAPRIALRLRPLTGYGARRPERTFGSNHLRFLLDGVVLRATTDAPLPMLRDELPFLLDREIHIVLGPDETLAEAPAVYVREALERRSTTGASGCATCRSRRMAGRGDPRRDHARSCASTRTPARSSRR